MQSTGKRIIRWIGAAVVGLLLVGAAAAVDESSDAYRRGQDALDDKKWGTAAEEFARVAEGDGRKADAALYWRAWALSKQNRTPEARASISELERRYPDSDWIDDARSLDARLAEEDPDAAIRSTAIEALMHQPTERALPILEKILTQDRPFVEKERAMFVLFQHGTTEAMALVERIVRDDSNPRLQRLAIQQLGVFGGGEASGALMAEIFASTDDPELRSQILQGYMISGNRKRIVEALDAAPGDQALWEQGLNLLGVMGATSDLERYYGTLDSTTSRQQILNAFMIAGESERLLEAARTEQDEALRSQAVQLLGVMGASESLRELYARESSDEIKGAILNAYMVSGETAPLLAAARDESSAELRGQAVQLLGAMGADDALWSLYENESSTEVKESILQAMFVSGDARRLTEIARTESNPRLRRAAIQALGLVGGAGEVLGKIYASNDDRETREAVLNALFLQGEEDPLIEIARTETDGTLRASAVRFLGMMGTPKAKDYLLELLDE